MYLFTIAQDIHYSQFFNSPLNLSPALTGVFAGEQRVTADYKGQWASVPVDYSTFSMAYDRNFSSYADTTGFFSAGVLLNYDKAGSVDLNLINVGLNASYSLRLNKKSTLTPGVQIAFNSRRYDFDKVSTGNQWNGEFRDINIPAEISQDEAISFVDLSIGLNYHRQTSYRDYLDLGVGIFHVATPEQSFNKGNFTSNLNRKVSVYGMSSFELASKVDLLLNALYSNQVTYQEIVLNAQGKIYLNKNKERNKALYLGLGYRFDDAFYPMIAIQYEKIYVSFNYDINISDFSHATGNQGGPELHFRYMIYNLPQAPFKPCPIY